MKEICNKYNLPYELSNLQISTYKNKMKFNNNDRMLAHNCHIFQSKEYALNLDFDLLYFVEDDYVHEDEALIEMIYSYQKFASQMNEEVILCPVDYPYLYKKTESADILIGNKYHWRTVNESLLTFLTSKQMIEKYWEKLKQMAEKENSPFETPLHNIYENETCLSPIPSLAMHCTNVNSIFGLSPNMNWKKLWEDSKP